MKANVNKLKQLVAQGRVVAHNDGPPPELVIELFETKPEIWCAVLSPDDASSVTTYSLPTIFATEKKGEHLQDSDLENTINILGDYFYACDALKIQAGQGFTGRFRNRPPLIFLWWD